MIRDDVEEQLQFVLSNVENVCYIRLVYRHKSNVNKSLYFDHVILKHLYNGFTLLDNNNHSDFKSI